MPSNTNSLSCTQYRFSGTFRSHPRSASKMQSANGPALQRSEACGVKQFASAMFASPYCFALLPLRYIRDLICASPPLYLMPLRFVSSPEVLQKCTPTASSPIRRCIFFTRGVGPIPSTPFHFFFTCYIFDVTYVACTSVSNAPAYASSPEVCASSPHVSLPPVYCMPFGAPGLKNRFTKMHTPLVKKRTGTSLQCNQRSGRSRRTTLFVTLKI